MSQSAVKIASLSTYIIAPIPLFVILLGKKFLLLKILLFATMGLIGNIYMENYNIILWAVSGGLTFIFGLMIIMWNHMNNCFDKTNLEFQKIYQLLDQRFDKLDQRFEKVDQRFDKLEEKMNDIDRRLCRLEGAFSAKDCCMIKDNHAQSRKAE